MKEEILDDTINVHGEDYVYLEVLERYNPLLGKLAIAFGAYLAIDVLSLVKNIFLTRDSAFYYSGFSLIFQLLIDVLLIAFTYGIWQQKKTQEAAHKRDFANNETQFLKDHYKSSYLLGFVFLVVMIRTLFFVLLY
ncbi:MAG: hypothetical protein AB8E82_19370 [Aureispira sp.]